MATCCCTFAWLHSDFVCRQETDFVFYSREACLACQMLTRVPDGKVGGMPCDKILRKCIGCRVIFKRQIQPIPMKWMWKWTNGAALHLQTKKRTMKQLPYHVITPFHLSFWNIFQNTRSRMGSDNNYYFELRPGINGKNSSFHFFFSGSSFPRRYLITSLVVDSSMTRAYACMQRTGKSSNGRHMLLLLWLRCQRV